MLFKISILKELRRSETEVMFRSRAVDLENKGSPLGAFLCSGGNLLIRISRPAVVAWERCLVVEPVGWRCLSWPTVAARRTGRPRRPVCFFSVQVGAVHGAADLNSVQEFATAVVAELLELVELRLGVLFVLLISSFPSDDVVRRRYPWLMMPSASPV